MSDATHQKNAQNILRELRDAVARDEDTDDLEDRFQIALEELADDALRGQLAEIWQATIQADAEDAFKRYAEAVAKIKPLADGFALGAQVARDGQRGLFFPSAAALLDQISGILEELKNAADDVIDNVDEVKDGIAVAEDAFRKGDVNTLIDIGEKIAKLWSGNQDENEPGLKDKLESIKGELTN